MKKRLDNERRRKNKAGSLRRWADYAKKAIAKAEELEAKRLGATKAQNNSKKTQQKPEAPAIAATVEEIPIEQQHNIIFKPNAGPQTDFLAAGEREVLYGGSAVAVNRMLCCDPLRFMGHLAFQDCYYTHDRRITGTYL